MKLPACASGFQYLSNSVLAAERTVAGSRSRRQRQQGHSDPDRRIGLGITCSRGRRVALIRFYAQPCAAAPISEGVHAPGAEAWMAGRARYVCLRADPYIDLLLWRAELAAVTVTKNHQGQLSDPVNRSGGKAMMADMCSRSSFLSRRTAAAAPGAVVSDINTTPLIDVMLVLLVTLIMTLPMMTHAIELDLPQTPSSREELRAEVINLDIDFDGTVVWNGRPIASLQQLESYFHAEARQEPQPEIQLRPDRRAKYDVVARVLASAQHNRMNRIGLVNTAEFNE